MTEEIPGVLRRLITRVMMFPADTHTVETRELVAKLNIQSMSKGKFEARWSLIELATRTKL